MIRAIMHGCCGAMGQVITSLAAEDDQIEIVAGIDPRKEQSMPYPVFASLEECTVEADVVIDFAAAVAVDHLLEYCSKNCLPVIVCTTGLSKEQLDLVAEAGKTTAVLRSANMSLGVNLLLKLVKEAALTLSEAGFDIEVVEKHHRKKVDAPSGTAIALADSINDAMGQRFSYQYDRASRREVRPADEIGISAVRGGTIVGEHDVIFAGQDEVVTFSHTAYSKAIFAKGAIQAAKYLAGKPAGSYTMADVIENR
ncbi:MAG: 4-hydroxy-tetrahydrodipicolinate reductase [Lachnospiraceae bacterium]